MFTNCNTGECIVSGAEAWENCCPDLEEILRGDIVGEESPVSQSLDYYISFSKSCHYTTLFSFVRNAWIRCCSLDVSRIHYIYLH